MFRTSNPAFNNSAYAAPETWDSHHGVEQIAKEPKAPSEPGVMTIRGAVNKTAILLLLCVVSAFFFWDLTFAGKISPMLAFFGGFGVSLVLMLIAGFKPQVSPFVAPVFALAEGATVGAFSAVVAGMLAKEVEPGTFSPNTGLVFLAAVLTFAILGGVLLGYATRLIRPGPVFRKIVVGGTIGAALFAMTAMITHFVFGSTAISTVYSLNNGGVISIGFSLLLIALASSNLVLDFELVEVAAANKSPKYYEWYSGMAILVTLVWLYIEVLRLLAKLQSRD